MDQSEALSAAIAMLERVAPGVNYEPREFYGRLRDIKATISPAGAVGTQRPGATSYPRTAIVDGEEYREISRRAIRGKDLILMESCRDGNEAPAIIVDANTGEVVLDEVYNGFHDCRDLECFTS